MKMSEQIGALKTAAKITLAAKVLNIVAGEVDKAGMPEKASGFKKIAERLLQQVKEVDEGCIAYEAKQAAINEFSETLDEPESELFAHPAYTAGSMQSGKQIPEPFRRDSTFRPIAQAVPASGTATKGSFRGKL